MCIEQQQKNAFCLGLQLFVIVRRYYRYLREADSSFGRHHMRPLKESQFCHVVRGFSRSIHVEFPVDIPPYLPVKQLRRNEHIFVHNPEKLPHVKHIPHICAIASLPGEGLCTYTASIHQVYIYIYIKVKLSGYRTEQALGGSGRLTPRIFMMFGIMKVVGRHPYAPAVFTPRSILVHGSVGSCGKNRQRHHRG